MNFPCLGERAFQLSLSYTTNVQTCSLSFQEYWQRYFVKRYFDYHFTRTCWGTFPTNVSHRRYLEGDISYSLSAMTFTNATICICIWLSTMPAYFAYVWGIFLKYSGLKIKILCADNKNLFRNIKLTLLAPGSTTTY